MTTPAEQRVIDAALVMSDEGVNDHWTACAVVVAVEALKAERPAPRRYLISYTALAPRGSLTHGRTFGAGPADGGAPTEKTIDSWEYGITRASMEPGQIRISGVAVHSFTELGQ